MNCFQLVKTVLDELYEEIFDAHGDDTNTVIKSKFAYLEKKYGNLEDVMPVDVDYSDPATRFAYVYRYTTAHANIVFQRIKDLRILKDVFNTEKLVVGCLGGGPGSDILGILKFLNLYCDNTYKLKKLNFTILDKESTWNETWYNIDDKIGTSFSFSTFNHFLSTDVTGTKALRDAQRIAQADVFTMIYFLSEIYAYREDTCGFFERLFDKAKPGALFLFVDNSRQTFYSWFDEVVSLSGLEIVDKEDYSLFQTGADEQKEALGNYYDIFGYPKLTAKIAYRVYRKKMAEFWDDDMPF